MSRFDGSNEKQKDGSDSASFRGKRHPFLDRSVDWKAIEKARYGKASDISSSEASIDSVAEVSREVDFEITGLDEKQERVEKCVAAVKQLHTNPDMWYRIRDYLKDEYREGGPKRKQAKSKLFSFVRNVNSRLGSAGELRLDPLIGLLARNVAKADNVSKPELSVHVTVQYPGGHMGPIGISFAKGS